MWFVNSGFLLSATFQGGEGKDNLKKIVFLY